MAYNPLNPNGQASMAASQPVVIASNQSPVSVLATIFGSPSVSGTVGAQLSSTNASVLTVIPGSVAAVIIGGSIAASFTPPANQSVSGTVTTNQGTSPWIITGSVQGSFSPSGNQSVSGTVGASIIGLTPVAVSNFPGNQSISGTVQVSSIVSIPAIVSAVNSTTATLTANSIFTGTSEDVKDFAGIVLSVFADQASATDGLSVQQSSNGTNWDITDTYTIPASTGKTFSFQPAARFLRVVYTNGGTNQGAFRMQTVYHVTATKPSSQRAQDAYTNETDLEQVWGFNSFWNGSSWDRVRGTTTAGLLINPGSSSILALQTGLSLTSIVGSYSEDAGHTSGDTGVFTMGVRNEQMSSITSTDLDYSPHAVGPVGETIVANSPLTKWIQGTASTFTGVIQPVIAAQGASIFTYITGLQVANGSSNNAYLTLFGATGSVVGYTVAPANGGSNIVLPNGWKTNANAAFSASISGVASVFLSAQGFISKT